MRIVRFEQFFKREEQGIKRFTFVFIVILVAVTSFAQQELNIVKENGLIGTVTNGEVSEIDAGQPTYSISFRQITKTIYGGGFVLGYATAEEIVTYYINGKGQKVIVDRKLTPKEIIPTYNLPLLQVTNVETFWTIYSDTHIEAVIIIHAISSQGGWVGGSLAISGRAVFH